MKKKAYTTPHLTAIEFQTSHGLLAGSTFDSNVDWDNENAIDANKAD